jgi:hypothetical protein
MIDVSNLMNSLKGISGSGNVLSQSLKNVLDFVGTLEPGDIARNDPPRAIAAPTSFDLWYLWYHMNFLANYYSHEGEAAYHFDYKPYLAANMDFLTLLAGLRPLKILKNIPAPITEAGVDYWTQQAGPGYDTWKMREEWMNNGVFWINTMAFELKTASQTVQYASDGPKDFMPNNYVGYITFPIGQLGVMEVISIMQETELKGYKFTAVDSLSTYWPKAAATLEDKDKPALQSPPEIFPDMKDGKGNPLAGQNYCYGRHLVESAYMIPDKPVPSQNSVNSESGGAYAPVPKNDVELFSSNNKDYGEDVKPKFWMRYWIHKDSTLPVPGEFVGILCRPVAAPPHVWWFQESSPFLYAGNWMETGNLTSGVITAVTLEAARTDGGTGNQYKVKVQGCEIVVDASDFLLYSIGDRVAVLKVASTATVREKSFTWRDQTPLKKTDELTKKTGFVIIPSTYYKLKH